MQAPERKPKPVSMPNLAVATLKEIARTAKVSIRTVARVTQGKGYVGAKTREKIDAAIAKLGYSPNLAARSLRTQRSFEIAVLVSSVDELHMEKLAGFSEALEGTGFRLVIFFSPHLAASAGGESKPDSEEWADRVLREKPAGVVLFSGGLSFDRALAKKLSGEKIPHVFLDSPAGELNNVAIDRPSGVYEAIHYLWKSGRRRIAFLGPETGAETRLAGFNRALDELGAKPILIHGSTRDEAAVRGIPKKWLASGGMPDAVQSYSDVMALHFLAGLHDAGIAVPKQIALIGFDDRKAAALSWPPLTTVAQPTREAGREAALALLERLRGEKKLSELISLKLPTRLIIRETA